MKLRIIKNLLANYLVLIGLLILINFQTQGQGARFGEYHVTSLDNELVAALKIDEAETSLEVSGEQLFGVAKRADKRKYYNNDNQIVYAVKYADGSFKLRDGQEQLLWKVKVYDSYLKISNNDEMTNAFRIGFSDAGKLKVKQGGEELYAIRYDQQASRFKAGEFYLMNFKNSLATGVILIQEISLRDRIILASEVIRAGK